MNSPGGKDSSALAIQMRARDYWRERLGKLIAMPTEKLILNTFFAAYAKN